VDQRFSVPIGVETPRRNTHQQKEAMARREAGEVLTEIARSYNVSHSTISRLH